MGMYDKSEVDVDCGKSMTKQSFADEVNINNIISKFDKTGMVTSVNGKVPFYGDVSEIVSYQEAIAVVERAEELFMSYPALVRERFSNDPARMIEFLSDPANLPEAIKLGLAQPKPEEAVVVSNAAGAPVEPSGASGGA